MPRVFSYLFLILFSMTLSACETTGSWLKGFDEDDGRSEMAQEQTIEPLPMDGSGTYDHAMGGNLEKLRRASTNYYGGFGDRQPPQAIDTSGAASAMDPDVEIYPIDGSYAPGSVLQPSAFESPPMSYEYQSMFPELGGVAPARRSSHVASSGGTGGGKALAPVLGGGERPSQIFFRHGSSRLGGGDKNVLNQVAEQAKFSPVMHVAVDGYASKRTAVSDPVLSAKINLRQSLERVNSVSSYLIEQGVPGEKLKTSTYGDTRLSSQGEAYDRRVDIITGSQ